MKGGIPRKGLIAHWQNSDASSQIFVVSTFLSTSRYYCIFLLLLLITFIIDYYYLLLFDSYCAYYNIIIYIHIYIHIHIQTHTYTCIYIHTHIHIYICIYIHTYGEVRDSNGEDHEGEGINWFRPA